MSKLIINSPLIGVLKLALILSILIGGCALIAHNFKPVQIQINYTSSENENNAPNP